MNINDIIDILRFSTPMITSLICAVVLIMGYRLYNERSRKKLTTLLVLANICSVFGWFSVLCYNYSPEIFVYIHSIFYLALLLNHLLFFNFLYILTQTNEDGKLPAVHYIIPFFIAGALAVWSLFVPFDAQLYIVTHNGAPAEGYKWYSSFFVSKLPMNAIYCLCYDVYGLTRLMRYRKEILNYSSDNEAGSLRWLYVFILISIAALPLTIISAILPRESIFGSTLLILPILITMFQVTIITYNMIVGNYIIIYENGKGVVEIEETTEIRVNEQIVGIDAYMREKKVYLNPELKITDLLADMKTNRTTLSLYINKTFDMNFSTWVNSYRLEEFNRLKNDSQYSKYTDSVLAEEAGFGSYRGYLRAKQRVS